MFGNKNFGADGPTMKDIEEYLAGKDQAASPTAEGADTPPAAQPDAGANGDGQQAQNPEQKPDVTETQAFAHRLKEATTKARNEERDNIAKELGYESYAALQKAREKSMLEERGLNPEEVTPVVEELVNKRLQEDPRLQELDALRQQRMQEWAKTELAELSQLTGGRVSKLDDIPKPVLELWKKKGSLKAAYIELEGEKLIREMRAGVAGEQSKGTTRHMQSPQGAPTPSGNENTRPLTQQEKDIYRLFNPNVTDEQLSKMRKNN